VDNVPGNAIAAARVCDAIMSVCLMGAIAIGLSDRWRAARVGTTTRVSRLVLILALGWLMSLLANVAWSAPSLVQFAVALTILFCLISVILLAHFQEWIGAAAAIAVWADVLAAAGTSRFVIICVALISFIYQSFYRAIRMGGYSEQG
jgi:hypothetical protein